MCAIGHPLSGAIVSFAGTEGHIAPTVIAREWSESGAFYAS
jgi:hypothetical protein